VSHAGPARESPHSVLAQKRLSQEWAPRSPGVPGARFVRAGVGMGMPLSRAPAIRFFNHY